MKFKMFLHWVSSGVPFYCCPTDPSHLEGCDKRLELRYKFSKEANVFHLFRCAIVELIMAHGLATVFGAVQCIGFTKLFRTSGPQRHDAMMFGFVFFHPQSFGRMSQFNPYPQEKSHISSRAQH